MTQEDKELLLKDLCARLPYSVKVKIKHYDDAWELLAIYTNGTTYVARDIGYPIETYFEDCKPYLFPLSSMTEEQKEEWRGIRWSKLPFEELDWLNKGQWDYRHLIEKGLAIDASEMLSMRILRS